MWDSRNAFWIWHKVETYSARLSKEEKIVGKLKGQSSATIQLKNDMTKIIGIVPTLEGDSAVFWWEILFGYSPRATSISI